MSKKKNKVTKVKKDVPVGIVHIQATFNNTIVSITDLRGNVLSWSAAGAHGFKGARKATPHAAQITASAAAEKAAEHGVKTVSVKVKGPGGGRDSAIKALTKHFAVALTKDVTPIAHNGCRPRKSRRV